GSFLDAAREHFRETLHEYSNAYSLRGALIFYSQLFATMLLGLILGRRRFFQDSADHLPLVRRVQWWALGIGLACGANYAAWQALTDDPITPTLWRMSAMMGYTLCRVLIMVFYVATLLRCVHNESWRR